MARFDNKNLQTDNLVDKLVSVNRVSKTVKGGKNMSFSALVVVGDKAGKVGFGKGKALEVQSAVQKATKAAKAKMIRVPLKEGRTLHHDISVKYGASKLVLRSAVPGTGIIAGGALRAVHRKRDTYVYQEDGERADGDIVRRTAERRLRRERTAPFRRRQLGGGQREPPHRGRGGKTDNHGGGVKARRA